MAGILTVPDFRPCGPAAVLAGSGRLAAFTASLHSALARLDALPDRAEACDPGCGLLTHPPSAASRPVDVALASSRQAAEQEARRWRCAPVVCSLTGDGLRERTAQWHEVVGEAVRTAIPAVLRLTLPAARTAAVAALAPDEQQCCPFFGFRLHLDGQELHLEVRTDPDGTGLLTDLFGPAA
ncbi:hypothetical protein [Streptomyces sp. IB2014 016-6]|uniref:hypothetical protein n=1 Tax=Streptomyces sp. IB2014 016-6 TaxID=2517818 RepID=UPI0011CBF21D|nr:hypothetical protein [Streptomyces sp. IB2014 016-6]TXL86633.1 hypothetical protein EW053_25915 [Streptomyces sp. IB2014 016-6]